LVTSRGGEDRGMVAVPSPLHESREESVPKTHQGGCHCGAVRYRDVQYFDGKSR
jgi:hypothetical protein